MKILIAPDKFKGSLTAREAAEAIARGFAKVFPEATLELLPLADGGEGILDAFQEAISGKNIETTVRDANHREVTAKFLIAEIEDVNTAIIESSQANGLWRIAPHERDLSRASTYGVGQLIRAAASYDVEKILIGIGGSATNDAGIGLAAALGYRFLDSSGIELDPIPLNIPRISSIDSSEKIPHPPITVACDVTNPLLGPRGATRIYGPQKGLLPEDIGSAEAAHAHLAKLLHRALGTDYSDIPGAGAAGGLGFGLISFCSATLVSGFDCTADALHVEEKIRSASIVITGEGALDLQTLEGKTPHGVSRLARKYGKPVYAIAGKITDEETLQHYFDGISSIVDSVVTLDEAISQAPELLEKKATRLARTFSGTTNNNGA